MSTIKAKNIKQTVINSTVQPLKIGGILDDGSDAKITIDTSGNLTASNLTATLNGLLTTNGQIKFPATQNPSADANTLDDYEEGSWTPVLTCSSGTITAYIATGYYIKIGRVVYIYFNYYISNVGTGSGMGKIVGMPFVSASQYEAFTGFEPYSTAKTLAGMFDGPNIIGYIRQTDYSSCIYSNWGGFFGFTYYTDN